MLDLIQTVLDFIANSRIAEFIQSILENFGLSSSAVDSVPMTPLEPAIPVDPETVPLIPLEPATPIEPEVPGQEPIPGAATNAEDPRLN